MAMVFNLIWTIALHISRSLETACKCCMTPFPAILALENIQVHVGSSHSSDKTSYIEATINNLLS